MLTSAVAIAQFTPGNVVVYETATGGTFPGNGSAIIIREFSPSGVAGMVVNIPTTGPNAMVGSAATIGSGMSLTPDGSLLVMPGYSTFAPAGVGIGTTSSASNPRVIGVLDASGTFTHAFTSSTLLSGVTINSACSDGTNFWAVGSSTSGVAYFGPGAQAAITTDQTNVHHITANGGQLSVRAANNLAPVGTAGIHDIGTGLPTTTGQTGTLRIGISSVAQGFQFNAAHDVCYVGAGNNVQKWTRSGTVWSMAYTMPTGVMVGATMNHVCADFSQPQPVVYATLFAVPPRLVKWTDTGVSTTGTVIATGSGVWSGVSLVPTCATMGLPCNDGDPNTINDQIGADCQCHGRSVRVSVKALLGGATDSGTLLMTDALRSLPGFPLSEPYTALGLPPTGGSTAIAPAVLSTTGNDAIVDWVEVELRNSFPPYLLVARRAALIQRDGDIVDLDGTSPLAFPANDGNYRVAVRHRNHLGIMTGTAFTLTTTTTAIDLTMGATTTYGTDARKAVGAAMALWPGDVTANDMVKYTGLGNDRDVILSTIGGVIPTATVTAYSNADVNLDSIVKYTGSNNDRDIILATIGGVLPTNTRSAQLP